MTVDNPEIKTEALPWYNDDAKCTKCGRDRMSITTVYHNTASCRGRYSNPSSACGKRYRSLGSLTALSEEHMLRHCTNCHYEWLEKPLNLVKRFIPITITIKGPSAEEMERIRMAFESLNRASRLHRVRKSLESYFGAACAAIIMEHMALHPDTLQRFCRILDIK